MMLSLVALVAAGALCASGGLEWCNLVLVGTADIGAPGCPAESGTALAVDCPGR